MKTKINFKRILFYLWPHVKKHWLSFSLVFGGFGIGIIFEAIIRPYLYKELIDAFSSGLPKDMILNQSLDLLLLLCIVIFIHLIGFRIGDFSLAYFESKVMKRLHNFSFNKLLEHSYNFFSSNFSGSLIAKSKRFSKSFETFFDVISFQIYFSILTLSGILVVLFIKTPKIAWIFLAWAFIYVLITFLFIKKKIRYDLLEAEADSNVTGRLSDSIINILNIKIFSSSFFEKKSFENVTQDEELKRRNSWQFGNFQSLIQSIMMALLQVVIIFICIKMWYRNEISIGTIVLLQAYMFNLFDILWNLGRAMTKVIKSLTDMKEMIDIFDLNTDISDPQNPEVLEMKNGHIKFNDVSFSYKNGNSLINKLNFAILPGEHVGLVGHSGAGKSTITKLLLRFADTTKGEITIDSQNIKNVLQDDLRSVIAYVPQDPILFHRTIKENIIYSKPDVTDEEMIAVAKSAYAHEFISKLPNGYDTLVGERGVKLSGGERQRVAIARAMLKNSPILVLDEATSSLDSLSEGYIQQAFIELMKNKTTLVIAHRLSTIQKMDRIIVLDNGKIVEDGTHTELLNKDGIYAELWNHQTGGFISE
ncbi:hypothetical protein A3C57_01055 [Candidatus Nomurabacteria bacterium RIFCSPHIGHO2_02_FULL_33_12]|uniref:ABC transporter ATP-binding protein n=1 Tax=Candidatus Nomurabacteria bacterium RIFCSPLOWO2_01_FULL_33_17 TaxID=1801764 RepID=A0A1F6WQS4_9BACT|nr:MAG: hypothetical protein A3C57_01055 [Candidatus Nomurabacteria bacterium RIFCSPHIGHO2_02_FULL_33_12]OGI84206.1 MAG: hypothetical protein A2903_00655 [Candidatus Nomurabacteria bacterium RIFCSPLOWO2_01_FULL_33_17]